MAEYWQAAWFATQAEEARGLVVRMAKECGFGLGGAFGELENAEVEGGGAYRSS